MFLPAKTKGMAGVAVLAALVVAGGFFAAWQFEWHPPVIRVEPEGSTLGRRPFTVKVQDRGKGLALVSVKLIMDGKSSPVHFRQFDPAVNAVEIPVRLDPTQLKLKDGPAVLNVTAADRSYWSFFRGNRTVLEKEVTVDFTPPRVEVISEDRYITQGGTGFVTYKASPDTERSGIRVGGYFFPGYKGHLAERDAFLAFFSHPYDVAARERAVVLAEDHAGNTRESDLLYNVRPLRYRRVKVPVSDDFIRRKIAPLVSEAGGSGGGPGEQFLKVNHDLRRVNEETIAKLCRASAARKLWEGRFVQLANSSVQANFADHRSYYYRDRKIDEARHLGYDLAVTRRYPVAAANSGAVVFAGPLGIYGNTVIIDHGFGLCSLYSHLSSVAVTSGEDVKKGANIGRTGETGLAIGDHLHYGVYIQGVAVLPLEWWDAKWIRDNVTGKLRRPEDPQGASAAGRAPRARGG